MDVSLLDQVGNTTTPSETDTSQEDSSFWDSEEDLIHGLEGSDLSEYIRDRADMDAIDSAFFHSSGLPDPSTTQTSSSFESSSATA